MNDEHKLIYDSLRDLKARCSCGGWSMSSPSFDRDSDDSIKVRATIYHDEHVERSNKRSKSIE